MEVKDDEKLKGETYLIIKKHFDTVSVAMPALQLKIMNNPKLDAKDLVALRKQYTDLQDTAHFLNSMYEAIDRVIHPENYSSRIITPPAPKTNGMKIIN